MPVVKKIDMRRFAREELPALARMHVEDAKKIVVDSILEAMPQIVEISPVDTGLYAQSWDYDVGPTSVTLGNTAPHAPVIEHGARPFTPPLAPLLAWAKRVLQDPSQPPFYSPEVQSLARGTQLKIQKYGMKPRHIMQKAVDFILENIRKNVRGR